MDFKTGGQKVIERLVEAYGFTIRQALCDHLGVSKSTLATRYMRDLFPAEWVVQCALETKASLEWLTTGHGVAFDNHFSDVSKVPRMKLLEGNLFQAGFIYLDKALINPDISEPMILIEGDRTLIADLQVGTIDDGYWLIRIEERYYARESFLLPSNKVRVSSGKINFDCNLKDIQLKAKLKIHLSTL